MFFACFVFNFLFSLCFVLLISVFPFSISQCTIYIYSAILRVFRGNVFRLLKRVYSAHVLVLEPSHLQRCISNLVELILKPFPYYMSVLKEGFDLTQFE